jgi:hypothetical protein
VKRAEAIAYLGVGAAIAAFRIPTLAEPPWYADDGFFTAGAWAMSQGVPLYAGLYDNQAPGIYWLYRLLLLVGAGEHHVVVQAAGTVAVVAIALLTIRIARNWLPLWPTALAGSVTGLVLSLPTLDGDLLNVELAALPFFLTALLLAFSRRPLALFAAGALLGVAVVTRPSFMLDGFALLVPLLSGAQRWRRLGLAAAGLASTAVIVVGALAAQGSLAAYLTVVLPSDHSYLVWANGGNLTLLYARLAIFAAISIAAFVRAGTMFGRLLAVWVPASIAGASLTPVEFTHYAHEAVPALAIALAFAASRIRRRWLAAPAVALAVVAAFEILLIAPAQLTAAMTGQSPPRLFAHNFDYQTMPGYYGNWLAYASGRETYDQYAGWYSDTLKQSAEVARLRSLAGAQHPRLLVLGNRPELYAESGLLPATRYLATNASFWRLPDAPGQVTDCIRTECAELVVSVSTLPPDWEAALAGGGYVELTGAAWPTFRAMNFVP